MAAVRITSMNVFLVAGMGMNVVGWRCRVVDLDIESEIGVNIIARSKK
jgi:hypothetical protein